MSKKTFLVINDTDGIYASPSRLTSEQADKFIEMFRERFRKIGYYTTSNWDRISPEEIQLRKIDTNTLHNANGKNPNKRSLEDSIPGDLATDT